MDHSAQPPMPPGARAKTSAHRRLFLAMLFSFCAAPGISATPYKDNLRYFNVIIQGPATSPYEGGIFKLELFLTEEYPMAPPKVRGVHGGFWQLPF